MLAPDLQRRPEVAAVRELALGRGRPRRRTPTRAPRATAGRGRTRGVGRAAVPARRRCRPGRLEAIGAEVTGSYSRERADTSHHPGGAHRRCQPIDGVGHGTGEPSKFEIAQVIAVAPGDAAGRAGRYRRALCGATAPPTTWLGPGWRGPSRPRPSLEALAQLAPAGDVRPSRAVAAVVARLRRPSLLVVLSDGWDGPDYADALRHAAAAGHDVAVLTTTAPGD